MKQRFYRAKFVWFMLIIISVMVMTACSFEHKEGTVPEAVVEPKTTEERTLEAENKKTETEVETTEIQAIVADDNTSIGESEIMAYITDFTDDKISIDEIEWVTVPSSRADELGMNEEDGPSGFCIYNPDTLTEQFTLSEDCKITVLDWQNSFEPKTISAEQFDAVLQERGELNQGIPYSIKVMNGTITEISEHYVP